MKAKDSERTEHMGVGIAMTTFESLGFAFREQLKSDYGIDAHAELIESGEPTGRLLAIQLKTGPSYFRETNDIGYIFRADEQHLNYWRNHALPVVVCLCDPTTGKIYWQVVNTETAESTGKGHKITIPTDQLIDASSVESLRRLLTPIVPPSRYTRYKENDLSHSAAKRYRFQIVLNGTATKAEIAAIVRKITNEGAKRRYHRNHLLKGQWGDSDADVVWTFIYPSAEDYGRDNPICRSIWISDDLPDEFRPASFDGENVGDSLIVDWNRNYDYFAKYFSENTLTKEDYLDKIVPLVEEMKKLSADLRKDLLALERKDIVEAAFLASTAKPRERLDQIYSETSSMRCAPFECFELDAKLHSFVANLHNVSLVYSDLDRENWAEENRLVISLYQSHCAEERLRHIEYELSKVR